MEYIVIGIVLLIILGLFLLASIARSRQGVIDIINASYSDYKIGNLSFSMIQSLLDKHFIFYATLCIINSEDEIKDHRKDLCFVIDSTGNVLCR